MNIRALINGLESNTLTWADPPGVVRFITPDACLTETPLCSINSIPLTYCFSPFPEETRPLPCDIPAPGLILP